MVSRGEHTGLRANQTHRFLVRRPWIEIQLVDESGAPLGDVEFELEHPDGTVETGKLDSEGCFKSAEEVTGACKVRFPGLDSDAWDVKGSAEARDASRV